MVNAQHLDSLNAEQLRALAKALIDQAASRKELLAGKDRQAKIDQLTHEMAVLKRWKFGRSGERLDPPQRSSTRSSMRTSPLSPRVRLVAAPMIADDPHWSAIHDNKSTFN